MTPDDPDYDVRDEPDVLDHHCDFCGAEPGEPCVSATGKPHYTRVPLGHAI